MSARRKAAESGNSHHQPRVQTTDAHLNYMLNEGRSTAGPSGRLQRPQTRKPGGSSRAESQGKEGDGGKESMNKGRQLPFFRKIALLTTFESYF